MVLVIDSLGDYVYQLDNEHVSVDSLSSGSILDDIFLELVDDIGFSISQHSFQHHWNQ